MSNNLQYISALVSIVVIVFLALGFNGSITGAQALGSYRGTSPACTETDVDQDDFSLGVVTIQERDGTREIPDTCFGKTVVQYFCINTVHFEGIGRYCPGGCQNGVCIP